MQWMNGAVVDLINIEATTGVLGLMMGSHWVEHPVSSPVSSSPDVVASHFFLSYSLGKLELKSKTLDKVGGVVLPFIPLFMLSAQI